MESVAEKTITKWAVDPAHSEMTFKVKHLMISNVKGEFKNFEVEMIGKDFSNARLNAKVDATSIWTNNEDRDNHLKSADFFDAENYPELKFEGTSLEKNSEDTYTLTGNLTIKEVTKEVKLDVEFGGFMTDPYGNEKAGFSVNGAINRKDWGLNWNAALEAGGVMVSEQVKINAEIQLIKQS